MKITDIVSYSISILQFESMAQSREQKELMKIKSKLPNLERKLVGLKDMKQNTKNLSVLSIFDTNIGSVETQIEALVKRKERLTDLVESGKLTYDEVTHTTDSVLKVSEEVNKVLESKEDDSINVPINIFKEFQKSLDKLHEKHDELHGKMSLRKAFLIFNLLYDKSPNHVIE